jgi:hypothetical protein
VCVREREHGDALMFPALHVVCRCSSLYTVDSLGHGKLADRYEIRFDQSRSAQASLGSRRLFVLATMSL